MENIIKQILIAENIKFEELKKSSSGFTNIIYFVDEKFVIKLSNDAETKKQLQKEINIYQNLKLKNIPKYISSGEVRGYCYLIITKLDGVGLFSVWHELDTDTRENCVKQIAQTIKAFNASDASFLNSRYVHDDWLEYITQKLKNRVHELKALGEDYDSVQSLIDSNFGGIFDQNKLGLVYNDAHFDNFLFDKSTGDLFLIDFDRVIFAPIDYELLIFKTMCDNALKFASEADESVVFNHEYGEVYGWFKKYYPEMFEIKDIEKRVKVYQFNYLLRQANEWKNPKAKKWREVLLEECKNLFDEGLVLTSGV